MKLYNVALVTNNQKVEAKSTTLRSALLLLEHPKEYLTDALYLVEYDGKQSEVKIPKDKMPLDLDKVAKKLNI